MTGNPDAEELKIGITKAIVLDSFGHYRYFSPGYDINLHNKNNKPPMPIFAVNCDSDKYPEIELRTERDLCWFVFKKYGAGNYRIMAWAKGKRYPWTFWRGGIEKDGFCFEKYNRPWSREIGRLRRMLKQINDPEERREIKNEINELKQTPGSDAPIRKPGFIPYIRPSARRGEFMSWIANDIELELDDLDDESREDLINQEMDNRDREESREHFREIEEELKESNPELFEEGDFEEEY